MIIIERSGFVMILIDKELVFLSQTLTTVIVIDVHAERIEKPLPWSAFSVTGRTDGSLTAKPLNRRRSHHGRNINQIIL